MKVAALEKSVVEATKRGREQEKVLLARNTLLKDKVGTLKKQVLHVYDWGSVAQRAMMAKGEIKVVFGHL